MAETADEIRAGIEGTRADLDRKLDLLETKARHELSLRNQFARRPWQALGAAAGLGVVLGLVFGGRDNDDEGERRLHRHGRRLTDRAASDAPVVASNVTLRKANPPDVSM
jgi:hypothetical protein